MRESMSAVLNRMPVLLIIVCSGLLVYVSTAVAKIAFSQLDPLYAVWYRVGFMVLMLQMWRRPWRRHNRALLPQGMRQWGVVACAGVAIVAMNTAFYIAIANMDIGIAVSLEFVGPLAVAVFTGHGWRERVGIVVATGGVVLLAGVSLAGPEGGNFLTGLVAILCGGAMWGVYIVTGRRLATRGNPVDAICMAMTIGWLVQSVFLAVPSVWHLAHPKAQATWMRAPYGRVEMLALMLAVAVLASFIPLLVDQVIMRRVSAATFSVMQSAYPAIAVGVGLMFGEMPSWLEVVGVSLVVVAVIITFSGKGKTVRPAG